MHSLKTTTCDALFVPSGTTLLKELTIVFKSGNKLFDNGMLGLF